MLNRIIGILVVFAIGVLAYPFAFNPHDSFAGHSELITQPPFPDVEAQNNTIKALDNQALPMPNNSLRAKAHNTKLASDDLRKNKHIKPLIKSSAWVIQVGSYKNKTKALSMTNQLRAKGYNAFIHQKNAAFGEEIQVFIGPEVKRDSAALIATKLAKETKLSGVVKSYKSLAA